MPSSMKIHLTMFVRGVIYLFSYLRPLLAPKDDDEIERIETAASNARALGLRALLFKILTSTTSS